MKEVEKYFMAVIQFFAQSAETQLAARYLKIPERSVRPASEVPSSENDLIALAIIYSELLQPFSTSDSCIFEEGETILVELEAILDLMLASNDPNLWIMNGLAKSTSWDAVRRLARIAVVCLGWSKEAQREDFIKKILEM